MIPVFFQKNIIVINFMFKKEKQIHIIHQDLKATPASLQDENEPCMAF